MVVRAIAVVSGGSYPKSFRSISLSSVEFKDFRNNVVVMGVVAGGLVVGGVAVLSIWEHILKITGQYLYFLWRIPGLMWL